MSPVILHLGLGAFHRAHQATYTEDANAAVGDDWQIEAVAMRNPALAQALNSQNGLFSLIIRHPEGPEIRQITTISRAWSLPDEAKAIIARFADPAVCVVTVTVTEKGYTTDAQGMPQWDDPVIAHDLGNPGTPRGLLGLVVAGLNARKAAGASGLTLISCDNLPDNGARFAQAVGAYAERIDPELAAWTLQTCSFPSSMVDRITPAANAETLSLARTEFGRDDPAAIETEPFRQWVIEDHFAGPRPRWEAAGALIVKDVRPFEEAKLRMLNGAHSLAAYAGALLGLAAVRDVMANATLADAIRGHMASVADSLDPIEGFDFGTYADDLATRFTNPAIDHRCLQIAMDGSQKLPQRIFEPALALADRGRSIERCALVTAIWLRFLQRQDEAGKDLPLNDPLRDAFGNAVARAGGDAAALVEAIPALLGTSAQRLWHVPDWRQNVTGQLEAIRRDGLESVLVRDIRQ